jgi:putative methylase
MGNKMRMRIKKKELEMMLQKVYDFEAPVASLEQYLTPASIAADILYIAIDDLDGKKVVDLGCGTGIFTIGSALLGADAVGVDIDDRAIAMAERFCAEEGIEARYLCSDVSDFSELCDTVIMNPPFGSQRKHADRRFMDKAMEISKTIYHLCFCRDFVERYYREKGKEVERISSYMLEIKHRFDFHTKDKRIYEVSLIKVIV